MNIEEHTKTGLSQTGLPDSGFVRLGQIVGPGKPIPVSRSTIYAWIQAGLFPAPVRLPGRVAGFRVEDVRAFIAKPMPKVGRGPDASREQPASPTSALS